MLSNPRMPALLRGDAASIPGKAVRPVLSAGRGIAASHCRPLVPAAAPSIQQLSPRLPTQEKKTWLILEPILLLAATR